MNIFKCLDDRPIMYWRIPSNASLVWVAPFGQEIIDGPTGKKLVYLKYYNSSSMPVSVEVGRRYEDNGLSFSPGLIVRFEGEEEFAVTGEIQTKILMEPEFSLEEIEQAQEVMDNLQ